MKKQTLDTAIHLGQLLTLLSPLGTANKAFHGGLSRLRAGVESQVALAVVARGTAAGDTAEPRIDAVYKALLGAVTRHVNVPDLLTKSAKSREVYPMEVIQGARRMNCQVALLGDALAVKLDRGLGKGSDQAARAAVVHAYASAVRNTAWLPLLLQLSLPLKRATSETARLAAEYSSHAGREALPDTLRKLCPADRSVTPAAEATTPAASGTTAPKRTRSKKASVKAEGLFAVQVVCPADLLLSNAVISSLVSVTFKGAEPEPTLAQLLEKATTQAPVGPNESPAIVAQRIVDELVGGLTARKQAADDARAALRAQAEAAAAESAVAALQDMNPALVAALKKNPALLERV
jgi:hypothetical protein